MFPTSQISHNSNYPKTQKKKIKKNSKKIKEHEKQKYGEIDQIFDKFDIDRNEYLDEMELGEAIRSYILVHKDKEEKLNDLLNSIDIRGKNRVAKEDFRLIMHTYIAEDVGAEELVDIFKMFDKNLSGEIGPDELIHVFSRLGLNLTEKESEKLIKEADNDGDCIIDFEEFIKIMLSK